MLDDALNQKNMFFSPRTLKTQDSIRLLTLSALGRGNFTTFELEDSFRNFFNQTSIKFAKWIPDPVKTVKSNV